MGNSYEYASINESATLAVYAGVDLIEAAGKAVKFSAGKAILAEAGEEAVGIILMAQEEVIQKEESVTIQIKDIGFWKAGTAVAIGDFLTPDADGMCQKAAAGQYILARALDRATAKGDMIHIQIIHAGYAK